MSDTIRLFLEGNDIREEQLVRGQSIKLSYFVSPIGAERLRINTRGTTEFVLETSATPSGLGDLQLFSGWFPKLGLKGEGGLVISSGKGWFMTEAGPKAEH